MQMDLTDVVLTVFEIFPNKESSHAYRSETQFWCYKHTEIRKLLVNLCILECLFVNKTFVSVSTAVKNLMYLRVVEGKALKSKLF